MFGIFLKSNLKGSNAFAFVFLVKRRFSI